MSQNSDQTAELLLDTIRRVAGELNPGRPPPALTLDSSLERDAGLDSLARVELLLRIERRLGVRIPDEAALGARTPRELLAACGTPASAAGASAPAPAARLDETDERSIEPPEEAGTLVEVLDWHARSRPGRVHLTLYQDGADGETLTYGALQAGADRVAGALRALGLGPGESVGLMLPSGMDFFYAFHGILRAGGVAVPIYPPHRLDQIEEHVRRQAGILANAEVVVLVVSQETAQAGHLLRPLLPALRHVVTVPELLERGAPPGRVGRAPEDLAFLQYTSGSTGSPKGVMLSHANLLANLRAMGRAVEAGPRDTFVSWLPLYHDMGLIGACFGTLYFGIPLVLMSPLAFIARPQRWLWALHRYRGTLSAAPNFAYEVCARKLEERDLEGLDLSNWRIAFNGAEPVNPETLELFAERFAAYGLRREALTPVYGLAESSVGLAFPPLGRGPRIDCIDRVVFARDHRARPVEPSDPTALRQVGCGRALPGHEMRVVGQAGQELPERHEGRLQFRGPSATRGYFRNPEATAELFQDDWLNTGDFAYLADGEVFLTGRAKDLIIRAGRNLYPYELEQAVAEVSGVRRGAVAVFASRPPEGGPERLVVLAETRERRPQVRAEMENRIREVSLQVLETPPDVIVLAPPRTVLKTSSGKIRRAACRELYEQGRLGARSGTWRQLLHLGLAASGPTLGRGLRRARALGFGAYAWLVTLLVAIPGWAALLIAPRPAWRIAVIRLAARLILAATGTRLRIQGLHHLPPGPCVLVANHGSYLDGPVLRTALPGALMFVAKQELRRHRLLRILLERMGVAFVERYDPRRGLADLELIKSAAARGTTTAFFPEGMFVAAPGLLPFRIGAFAVAAECGLPVVPVAVRGTRAILPGDERLPRPGAVQVLIGDPLQAQGRDWRAAIDLRDRARAWILAHCDEPDAMG